MSHENCVDDMGRTKSDISNSAIRIFLQQVGKFYDQVRGFEPFGPKVAQKEELLAHFDNACCFCGTALDRKSLSQDHLIPMNKETLGLHAWGNVVPCCSVCNNKKHRHQWRDFLSTVAGDQAELRATRIETFIQSMNYDPSLDLREFAGNLYEDVGQVAMTLIDLRYKQAESAIKELVAKKVNPN